MDPNPAALKPLQFDTAARTVPAEGGASTDGVGCVTCRRPIRDMYFDVDGQTTCRSCRQEIAKLAETPREWGVFARACLYGFVAAILGAIVYYAVIAITDFEIGIVAIAIGYMVGYGVRMATGGRGGKRFQIVALVLTYWAVGLAYTPLVIGEMSKQESTQEGSGDAAAPADTPAPAADAPAPAAAEAPALVTAEADAGAEFSWPLAVAFMIAFSFALPVLAVVSSMPGGAISALIIGVGMHQAWRMTAAPQPQITGPFRIGAAPPAPAA